MLTLCSLYFMIVNVIQFKEQPSLIIMGHTADHDGVLVLKGLSDRENEPSGRYETGIRCGKHLPVIRSVDRKDIAIDLHKSRTQSVQWNRMHVGDVLALAVQLIQMNVERESFNYWNDNKMSGLSNMV